MLKLLDGLTRRGIHRAYRVYLVAEVLYAQQVVGIGQCDIHRVTFHAELTALQVQVVAHILCGHQLLEQLPRRLSAFQPDAVLREIHRTTHAVDATYRRDDDDVLPSTQQGGCRAQTQAVDLLVDAQVLVDIGVGAGDIGLGLIVVVVTDEVLYGVMREEHFHLRVELRRQGLVVAQYQRRTVEPLDHVGHGEGLAASRHAQQHLSRCARLNALYELINRLRLIARRSVFTLQFKQKMKK